MSDHPQREPEEELPVLAIIGCYALDLYCTSGRKHAYGTGMGQFTGKNETCCIDDARAAGWTVTKGYNRRPDRAACPRCRRTRKREQQIRGGFSCQVAKPTFLYFLERIRPLVLEGSRGESAGSWFRRRGAFSTERCLKVSAKMADRAVIDFRQRTKAPDSNAK